MSVFETECEWTLLHGGLHNANTDLSVRLIKDKPTERIKRWLKFKASSYGCYPGWKTVSNDKILIAWKSNYTLYINIYIDP